MLHPMVQGHENSSNQNHHAQILPGFFKNKQLALDLIDISFLSDEFKNMYKDLLEDRYKRLEG